MIYLRHFMPQFNEDIVTTEFLQTLFCGLTFQPNSKVKKNIEFFPRGVRYGSVSAMYINISPAESVSVLETSR